jgi:hypothetical protein
MVFLDKEMQDDCGVTLSSKYYNNFKKSCWGYIDMFDGSDKKVGVSPAYRRHNI